MIVVELCTIPFSELNTLPERLIHDILVYRNVKLVAENGGDYDP